MQQTEIGREVATSNLLSSLRLTLFKNIILFCRVSRAIVKKNSVVGRMTFESLVTLLYVPCQLADKVS